jgi:hypothetical protein
MDIKLEITQANEEAVKRMMSGDPALVDIAPAGGDEEMMDILEELL